MDLKKSGGNFFVRQQLPAKTEKVPFRFISLIFVSFWDTNKYTDAKKDAK
jgi:hypothetical protein